MTLLSTAYAGSADIDPENIDALLNQILPDGPLGMVYIPDEIPRRAMPGLTKVVAWLEKEIGKEGTIPVKSPVDALLERNAKLEADGEDQDELVLVMLYSPDSDGDVSLAKAALGHGIRVVDLTAAGDDLIIEDEAPPAEPETPAQPEPEAPPAETPAARVRKATAAGVAAAKPAPEPEPAPAAGTPEAGVQFNLTLNIPPEGMAAFARAILEAMGAQAQVAVSAAPADVASVAAPIGTTGGNASDPAGQPQGTAVYYHNTDEATYRPARGSKKRNEERVFLTPGEVAEAKAKGMLG